MHSMLIDLTRQNCRKLICKAFQPGLFLGDVSLEFVISDQSWDGREQPYRRCEQSLCDPRCYNRQRSIRDAAIERNAVIMPRTVPTTQ